MNENITTLTTLQTSILTKGIIKQHPSLRDREIRIKGNAESILKEPHTPRVLVIGSRDINPKQAICTRKAIEALSGHPDKPIIISGLAFGTDTAAHRAALDMGMKTYAVVATGLDTVYPVVNRKLAEDILSNGGGIITPYPDKTAPIAFNFLERTQLMVMMSDAIVVICSKSKGSSMLAARYAEDFGIPVYAFPGEIDDPRNAGSNLLIKEGVAEIITDLKQLETI